MPEHLGFILDAEVLCPDCFFDAGLDEEDADCALVLRKALPGEWDEICEHGCDWDMCHRCHEWLSRGLLPEIEPA